MNTAALKRFAQQARLILKSGVEKRLLYWGFDRQGNVLEEPVPVNGGCLFRGKTENAPAILPKWKALKETIAKNDFQSIAEEAAYTWFNRLMAIQIMAKNDYIAPQLAFESDRQWTPQIITHAKRGRMPAKNAVHRLRIDSLLNDDSLETELFASLITVFCQNHSLLQRVFGRLDDWTELLLPSDILADSGFVRLLNTTDAITDDDYRKVELIGWLYQFYISERKEEVFRGFQNKKKAEVKDIPAATQIFTPNWIVKYMVQNTVGRLWLDLNPDSPLRNQMPYLCTNSTPTVHVIPTKAGISLCTDGILPSPIITSATDIKLLDPACGSGHILSEGFDLLFEMYMEEGYSKREAVRHIFTHNLYGLDIDQRAAQLANFALLMKAAQHDRQTLDNDLRPQIYAMPPPYLFDEFTIAHFLGENKKYTPKLTEILNLMQQAQNLGSIMQITIPLAMRDQLQSQLTHWENQPTTDVFVQDAIARLKHYIRIILLLTQQYEAVAANPPYMGNGNMNEALKTYINRHYPEGKSDLFSVFMLVALNLCVKNGRMGMINMHSWMFLSSFEALRKKVLENYFIENMLHLGPHTFDELSGEVVQNTAFVLKNTTHIKTGVYFRLVEGNNCSAKEQMFIKGENRFSHISQSNFENIPGSPVAYWVSEKIYDIFSSCELLKQTVPIKKGLSTGKNDLFIRNWTETDKKKNSFINRNNPTWFPYNKGGEFRKWFGNRTDVINWLNNGLFLKSFSGSVLRNQDYYMKSGITWSAITSSSFSCRFFEKGFLFDGGGSCAFPPYKYHYYLLAYLNSKVSNFLLNILIPTLNFEIGTISKLPFKICLLDEISTISYNCVQISRRDWDSRETSWDFKENELILRQAATIEDAYRSWLAEWTAQFKQLHGYEVELNRLFIEIYGLQDELTPEVKLKDVTILQDELDYSAFGEATEPAQLPNPNALPVKPAEVVGQLLSYIVGCVMGRYRLDKPGLHIAHPNPTADETDPYEFNGQPFRIDEDAIVPLMDAACGFADNALNRIKDFIELVWGENNLTANLNFIEAALGKDLETYLMKDFWKEHCSRYQKRPIYWLFASPKGAFRALAYMHRMNRFTVEKIRSQYLLRYIRHLETRREALEIDVASLDRLRQRTLEKIRQDIAECRAYDLLLKDVADHQIAFNLDDGVVVNHAKFAPVVAAIK